jgi:hypothetical protein
MSVKIELSQEQCYDFSKNFVFQFHHSILSLLGIELIICFDLFFIGLSWFHDPGYGFGWLTCDDLSFLASFFYFLFFSISSFNICSTRDWAS